MVAWARMLSDYTEERGLITGMKETFDGEHACEMCRKIAEAKSKEQSQKLPLNRSGLENLTKWFSASLLVSLPAPRWRYDETVLHITEGMCSHAQWAAKPPIPPPKLAA